jgi:hypothetical protein
VLNTKLLEIGHTYTEWTRVSDTAHFAPWGCLAKPPSGAQFSTSDDAGSHGRKLYFLFAKDADAYQRISRAGTLDYRDDSVESPAGQALVKQSWRAIEIDPADVPRTGNASDFRAPVHPPDYLIDGGRAYRAGEPGELFVMLKLDPTTPNTDHGWVYATLTADGSRIIESGRIASCMRCHRDAPKDRLFGQPWSWSND